MEVLFDKKALIEGIKKEAVQIEKKASKEAAERSKNTLVKAYDLIIDQYYLYKTTSYYRHKTGIGTKTGWNLYQSNNIAMLPSSAMDNDEIRVEALRLDISADDMLGYYRFSKHKVLDMILDGIRGVPNKNPSWLINKKTNKYMMMFQNEREFSAKITIESDNYSGTPREIMKQISKKVENTYYQKYWDHAWRTEVRKGKYEFFNNKKIN